MEKQRKVVLYGNSLSVFGIDASLKNCPGFEVVRIDAQPLNAMELLESLGPDVICFDMMAGQPPFAIPLLQRHSELTFIGLDFANDKVLVLSGEQKDLFTMGDLVRVIDNNASATKLPDQVDP